MTGSVVPCVYMVLPRKAPRGVAQRAVATLSGNCLLPTHRVTNGYQIKATSPF